MEQVAGLKPDYLGFIFHPGSPRYVGRLPDRALFMVPDGIRRVGVFVDAEPDLIMALFQSGYIDMAQLHGEEPADYCRMLKEEGMGIIKAIPANRLQHQAHLGSYAGYVDYLLVDTPTPAHGGSGMKFDWSLLDRNLPLPFFLSGGLGPGDSAPVLELDHPGLAGLDLNSRFETSLGMKDHDLLHSFIQEIRNTSS